MAKSVKIQASNTTQNNDKKWPTVNIVTTPNPNFPTHVQRTGDVMGGAGQFVASATPTPGLKTICIPGYSAPG